MTNRIIQQANESNCFKILLLLWGDTCECLPSPRVILTPWQPNQEQSLRFSSIRGNCYDLHQLDAVTYNGLRHTVFPLQITPHSTQWPESKESLLSQSAVYHQIGSTRTSATPFISAPQTQAFWQITSFISVLQTQQISCLFPYKGLVWKKGRVKSFTWTWLQSYVHKENPAHEENSIFKCTAKAVVVRVGVHSQSGTDSHLNTSKKCQKFKGQ